MKKMKITLPIFFINENDATLQDLGIKTNIEDSDVREITFYHINYIATYIEDGKSYGLIGTNDENMISPWSKEKIEKLIDEQSWK